MYKDNEVELSKEVLGSLTMEDPWKSPRLKKLVEEKYPRIYSAIKAPFRDFRLYNFIKLAESQKSVMQEAIDLDLIENLPIRNIDSVLKVIKKNKIKVGKEFFVSGIP